MKARTKLFFVAVLGLLALCGSAWAVESSGPIAHWKFDEGSGTIAYDSAGDNDGTIYGAVWTDGQIGGALSFDGDDDYVRTLNNIFTNAQLASGATLSAWFRTDSTAYGYIADNEAYLTLGVNHIYATNPNKLVGIVDGGYHRYFSSSDVTNNLWHHAAIVWDGSSTAILYLDGIEVSSGASRPPIPDSKNRPFVIGAHSTIAAFFNGTIDDVRVYDRVLSAEEIQQLYQDGLSSYERAVINIDDAIAEKAEAMERIDAALEKEWAAYDALEELLESGDYGDLSKGDIVKAKQKIRPAIQQEEQAIDALEKSIEKLRSALAALGLEPEPDPNLVAHWKFDEGEGSVAYDSAGDNDGTIYGAQWTTGQINGALNFDGDGDYVRTIYEGGPSEYTISLWYNLNEDIVPSTMIDPVWRARALVSKTGDEQYKVNLWSIWFGYYGLELVNEIAHNTYVRVSYEPAMFYKDEWCHVVVTGNSTHGQIYFDGELINTVEGNFSGGVWDDSVPFEIARPYTGTANRYFNGIIDEVMIFNKALSADQIQQLYQNGLDGHSKGKK